MAKYTYTCFISPPNEYHIIDEIKIVLDVNIGRWDNNDNLISREISRMILSSDQYEKYIQINFKENWEVKCEFHLLEIQRPCIACMNEIMGQDAHLECPNGCLHDPSVCDTCIICNQ